MPYPIADRELSVEDAIHTYVLTRVALAIYDPMQSRRPKADVLSFEIEILEFEEDEAVAHAAGPVVLRGPQGDVEQFLRISLPFAFAGGICSIPENPALRAAYIVPTDHPNGACKETAALAST